MLFVAVISFMTVEGKLVIWHKVELKWKMEVLNIINYMTISLQVGGDARGICP